MTIVFYITGHGFGHATRQLEIIRHIHRRDSRARIVVRTRVPRWFLERSAGVSIEVEACDADTGVTQIDSLRLDETATVAEARRFYRTFTDRVDAEAATLQSLHATVVIGDVPPLAFAAAERTGIPSIAVANFTWDWIYAAYPAFREHGADILDVIGRAYAAARQALRLPFAGGFETMSTVRDVPLVARRSRRSRDENRRLLGLDGPRPIVLASFGGHGAALPFEEIVRSNDLTLLLTDYEAKSASDQTALNGRLRRLATRDLDAADIRYEDLVSAADVVVSKPGYGIVSECIANRTALLYTSRGVFAENDVIVTGMQPFLRSLFIGQDEVRRGVWEDAIRALMESPEPPEQMPINGADVVAEHVLEY